MIFWGLRLVVSAAAIVVLIANWRMGLVVIFALAADFITYLWMALPLFSVRNELLALLSVGVVVGATISIGRKALMPPWLAAAVCTGLLVLLRGSLYLVGFGKGTLPGDDFIQTLPSALVLIVGSGASMLLPAIVFGRRSSRQTD